MKKMMTCRSSRPWLVAFGALLLAAPLAAQDTGLTVQGQRVHIVRRGETLWTLAERYFGDPLLWPSIYRINPHVVEDPHWIFPGEELLLVPPEPVPVEAAPIEPVEPGVEQVVEGAPPDSGQVAPPPPPPPPAAAATQGETVFAANRFRREMPGERRAGPPRSSMPGRMVFYSAGFLTEDEVLPWAEILGATDQSTFGTLTATSAASVRDLVRIRAPANATYQVGDSLISARRGREVLGWGRVIKPTGILLVTRVAGRDVIARVLDQFDRVSDGQVALPIDPFRSGSGGPDVAVENGLEAHILTTRDQHAVPSQYNIMFIDKGREDGVALGDVFQIILPREGFPDDIGRAVALIAVVHVRNRSATVQVITMADIGFGSGDLVRMVRRAS